MSKKQLLPLEEIAIQITPFDHLSFIALPRVYRDKERNKHKEKLGMVYAVDKVNKKSIQLFVWGCFGRDHIEQYELPSVYTVTLENGALIGRELAPGSHPYNKILKWTGYNCIENTGKRLYHHGLSTRNLLKEPSADEKRASAHITKDRAIELLSCYHIK